MRLKENAQYIFSIFVLKPSAVSRWLFLLCTFSALSVSQEIYVHSFSLTGNSALSSQEIFQRLETKEGSVFSPSLLEQDIQSVLELYGTSGFPFAAVRTDSIRIADSAGNLDIHLSIDEGPKFFIDDITVEGNTQTSRSIIVREARLQKGEIFNQSRMERFRKRLERLQLFSSVSEPQLYVTSGILSKELHGGVLVTVKEGNTNQFDGAVGYVPKQETGSSGGYFTGNIFIGIRNLFGTARKTVIRWQRETEKTQELELQYSEPWLFSIPLSLSIGFLQRKQDSTYIKTTLTSRFEYALTEELSIALGANSENVIPSADLKQFTLFESETNLLNGKLLYDTRDSPQNPTTGVTYETTFQQGVKKITGPVQYLSLAPERKTSMQRWSVDAAVFTSLFYRQVLALVIHGKQIAASYLELSDLYQLGGTNSVRGYRENQFFASQLVWMNAEYRFLTGRTSSFFGFFDAGYFFRPNIALQGITQQEQTLYGYGIGAKVESALGILNISFALGKEGGFSQGKIHLGIINDF